MVTDAKANPNIADKNGMTPLKKAVDGGLTETVKLLLEAKADPNLGPLGQRSRYRGAEQRGREKAAPKASAADDFLQKSASAVWFHSLSGLHKRD